MVCTACRFVTNRGSRMGIAGAFTSLFMMGIVPPAMYADGKENGWQHTYQVSLGVKVIVIRPCAYSIVNH
jgi:hypothetical protein